MATVMANTIPPKTKLASIQKFWLYLRRATYLRCPVCGISPIFLSFKQVESIPDWFATLPGCPRCDYVYDREPGYFLLALWVINFGLVAVVGIGVLFLLDYLFTDLSVGQLLFFTLVPLWGLGILSARHTKAFFMALDHWVNPINYD